jgi:hypothetical protein
MSNIEEKITSSSICPKCSTDTSFEEQTILRSCSGCGLTYAVKHHPVMQTLQDIKCVADGLQSQLRAEIKKAIIEEANILRTKHPSKDCRFFANSVLNFLKEKQVEV